jgi:precorrin-2/cobalt-factor-2 C20-methyltransferase
MAAVDAGDAMALGEAMTGTLFGIGTGPGDPELITLKAARLIEAAQVITYLSADGKPGLARSIASAHIDASKLELAIDMPMRVNRDEGAAAYDKGAAAIAAHLRAGSDVAFLCEGDPLFFGSFMYVMERLAPHFPVEIVPGVPSPMAAAARARLPLCAREDVFTVVPATLPDADLMRHLPQAQGVAIMKLGRHLPRLKALLARIGLIDHATYVEKTGMAEERIAPLATINDAAAPYFSMILISRASVAAASAQPERQAQ